MPALLNLLSNSGAKDETGSAVLRSLYLSALLINTPGREQKLPAFILPAAQYAYKPRFCSTCKALLTPSG